jgi:hypothetical protein
MGSCLGMEIYMCVYVLLIYASFVLTQAPRGGPLVMAVYFVYALPHSAKQPVTLRAAVSLHARPGPLPLASLASKIS